MLPKPNPPDSRYQNAYAAGRDAHNAGQPFQSNPHIWYTIEGQAWDRGWNDASRVAEWLAKIIARRV